MLLTTGSYMPPVAVGSVVISGPVSGNGRNGMSHPPAELFGDGLRGDRLEHRAAASVRGSLLGVPAAGHLRRGRRVVGRDDRRLLRGRRRPHHEPLRERLVVW